MWARGVTGAGPKGCIVMSDRVKSSQVGSSQVKSSQVRLGQVRSWPESTNTYMCQDFSVQEEEGMGDIVEVRDQGEERAKVVEVSVIAVVEERRDGERVGRVQDVRVRAIVHDDDVS